MNVSKILLTTDLSEESLRAFEPAAQLARIAGASITLLYVVEDVPVTAHGAPGAPAMHAVSLPDLIEDGKGAIAKHAANLPSDVPIQTDVITGASIAEAVADYAQEHGHDLIALSTHGRSGFKRLFLGSVAEKVLRHAHVPVLAFPRNA